MENAKVLASVNGKQITQADVENMIASMGQQGQAYRNPQGYEAVLEQLINQSLLLLDDVVYTCPVLRLAVYADFWSDVRCHPVTSWVISEL